MDMGHGARDMRQNTVEAVGVKRPKNCETESAKDSPELRIEFRSTYDSAAQTQQRSCVAERAAH